MGSNICKSKVFYTNGMIIWNGKWNLVLQVSYTLHELAQYCLKIA
jgi:hypothetical protein